LYLGNYISPCKYPAYYRRRVCGDRHDGYKPGAGADWQARLRNEGESRGERTEGEEVKRWKKK